MSLDPLEGGLGQPMSLNRYSYVQGNPVNWTDPLGYGPEVCLAALAGGPLAPEIGLACLLGFAVGGAALAYLAFRASRSTQKINIYSSGIPGNLSLDQSIQQYSQIFNSLERARSQDCSGLTPGGDRERCNQRYAQREREALEQTVIPGFIREADYVLQEIEEIVKEVTRKPQPQPKPGQTMIPPYIPPVPPTICPSPTATSTSKICDPQKVVQWMSQFKSNPTNPTTPDWSAYQYKTCGPYEYEVRYNGISVNADGIRPSDCSFLDAKHVGDPKNSPFIPGSGVYPPVATNVANELTYLVSRYTAIINDSTSPMVRLEISTNTTQSQTYLRTYLRNTPGTVALVP